MLTQLHIPGAAVLTQLLRSRSCNCQQGPTVRLHVRVGLCTRREGPLQWRGTHLALPWWRAALTAASTCWTQATVRGDDCMHVLSASMCWTQAMVCGDCMHVLSASLAEG